MKRYKMEEMEEHNVLEMAALTLEDLVVAHKGGDGGARLSGDGCPRLVGEAVEHPHISGTI